MNCMLLSIVMPTKSMLICFTIIAAALSLTTIAVVSSWANTPQPALAKITSATENNHYLEDVVVATSQKDEISSRVTLVGYEEEQSDNYAAEDIDESSNEASSANNYEEEVDEEVLDGEQECRKGDVLRGVYDPERLNILSSCEEAIGIVDDSERAHDGDYKLYLDVEDEYKTLLNKENDEKTNGLLVVEIIPKDQDSSLIQIPEEGDRIRVVGAWVTDEGAGGWNEIHPAWKVEVLE